MAHPNERGSEDQRCVYTVLHGQPSPRPTVPHSLASNAGTTVFDKYQMPDGKQHLQDIISERYLQQ